METNTSTKPVLVTLTAPSGAGKSYLFNYIRDVAKLPCLISTTTRSPRAGEVEGLDYYFISEEESKRLEADDKLAELAIYNGVRYGVTKEEFHSKLNAQGIAFLIVEPSGIDHYVQPALDAGALHYKAYIHVDPEIRMQRFRERAMIDMEVAANAIAVSPDSYEPIERVLKELKTSLNRLTTMLTEEDKWATMHHWDRMLFGTEKPEVNLEIILNDVQKLKERDAEARTERERIEKTSAAWTLWAESRKL